MFFSIHLCFASGVHIELTIEGLLVELHTQATIGCLYMMFEQNGREHAKLGEVLALLHVTLTSGFSTSKTRQNTNHHTLSIVR